jgi:hypothetical protein
VVPLDRVAAFDDAADRFPVLLGASFAAGNDTRIRAFEGDVTERSPVGLAPAIVVEELLGESESFFGFKQHVVYPAAFTAI